MTLIYTSWVLGDCMIILLSVFEQSVPLVKQFFLCFTGVNCNSYRLKTYAITAQLIKTDDKISRSVQGRLLAWSTNKFAMLCHWSIFITLANRAPSVAWSTNQLHNLYSILCHRSIFMTNWSIMLHDWPMVLIRQPCVTISCPLWCHDNNTFPIG